LQSIIGNFIITQIIKEGIYYEPTNGWLLKKITLHICSKTTFAQFHLGEQMFQKSSLVNDLGLYRITQHEDIKREISASKLFKTQKKSCNF
jgi:hypothetical protein